MNHTTRSTLLTLLAVALLLVAGGASTAHARAGDEPPGPTKEEVAAEVAKLERVLAEGAFDEKVDALVAARAIAHDDIVSVVAGATKDKAKEVRLCAITSLGYLKLPSALRELYKLEKKKALVEDEQTAIELYRAIGRHADKKSIKVLEDNILASSRAVLECRVFAIARVRDIESVETIVSLMNKLRATDGGKGEPKGGQENVPHMATIRLALHVLTGADEGLDRRTWQTWWNKNKRDLVVTEAYPKLDRQMETRWKNFWNEGGAAGRREGRDGEGRGGRDGGEGGESDGGDAQGSAAVARHVAASLPAAARS